MDIRSDETHSRTHRVVLGKNELNKIVAEAVACQINDGLHLDRPGVTVDITYEDETEGSPSYRVGTKAIVKITENLAAQTGKP